MISVNNSIEHVTVYREGALVRRVGSVVRESGKTTAVEIAFKGLPLNLDDSSVRSGLVGSSVSDKGVQNSRVILEAPEPDPDLKAPGNTELKIAGRSVQKLQRELGELEISIGRTRGISWPERQIPEDLSLTVDSPLEERAAFAVYLGERLETQLDKRKKLQVSLKKATEKLQILMDQEQTATSAMQNRVNEIRKTVVLSLGDTGASKDPETFFLEYLIPAAKWTATYGLRFNSDFSESRLDWKAMVAQASGEDWSGVDISLSTALPNRWYDLPELPGRRIGRVVAGKPKTGWKAAPQGADMLFTDFDSFMSARASMVYAEDVLDDEEDEYEEYDDFGAEADSYAKEEQSAERMKMSAPLEMIEESIAEPPAPKAGLSKKSRAMSGMAPSAMPARLNSQNTEVETGEASVSDAMLDYTALRIGDSRSDSRSFLKLLSRRDRKIEMLSDMGLGRDTLPAETGGCSDFQVPNGCIFPSPVDGYDFTYIAETPVSIPSDGIFHSIPLQSGKLASSTDYIVVPREDCSVFAVAELKNEGKVPLMPGPVDIRVESDFLCTGAFDVVPSGGTAQLGLGVEQGIKVARNTQFKEQSSGLTGGNLTLRHSIRINVTNNLGRMVNLEIRERIPTHPPDQVKGDEKVKIEIGSVQPPWKSDNQAPDYIDGAYKWELQLEPGEESELNLEYDISIPSNTEVVGGNNREAE